MKDLGREMGAQVLMVVSHPGEGGTIMRQMYVDTCPADMLFELNLSEGLCLSHSREQTSKQRNPIGRRTCGLLGKSIQEHNSVRVVTRIKMISINNPTAQSEQDDDDDDNDNDIDDDKNAWITVNDDGAPELPEQGTISLQQKKSIMRAYVTEAYSMVKLVYIND